jgi:hypothetical protein
MTDQAFVLLAVMLAIAAAFWLLFEWMYYHLPRRSRWWELAVILFLVFWLWRAMVYAAKLAG